MLDFSIRMVSNVCIGGQNVMWAAATNLIGMAAGGFLMLSNYGKKIFGDCIGRFGGCFVAGTPIVIGYEPDIESFEASDRKIGVATRRKTVTQSIELIRLGSRVVTEPVEQVQQKSEYGDPDPLTWQQVNLLHHRVNGTEIHMELLRPRWWINLFGLQVGETIDFSIPELQTSGHAKVLSVTACPNIQPGEGRVVIGRFVTEKATNLLRFVLDDGSEFIGTTTHPIWSAAANTWLPLEGFTVGDYVTTLNGIERIAAIEPAIWPMDVFNIEVECDHIFRILGSGVLAHNGNYPSDFLPVDIISKLTRPEAKAWRSQAQRLYEKASNLIVTRTFQVHHRIPLEWAHLFPNLTPNRMWNLVGLPSGSGSIHDEINKAWLRWKLDRNGIATGRGRHEFLRACLKSNLSSTN